jgi:hypothetical protein
VHSTREKTWLCLLTDSIIFSWDMKDWKDLSDNQRNLVMFSTLKDFLKIFEIKIPKNCPLKDYEKKKKT